METIQKKLKVVDAALMEATASLSSTPNIPSSFTHGESKELVVTAQLIQEEKEKEEEKNKGEEEGGGGQGEKEEEEEIQPGEVQDVQHVEQIKVATKEENVQHVEEPIQLAEKDED